MKAIKLATVQELQAFEHRYDNSREDRALQARGRFLQLYPLESLAMLTLDDYVIGKGTESFCAMVEAKSRAWANIQGATAFKFGLYYGVTKAEPDHPAYRFTKKFGESRDEAFSNIKDALLALIDAGKARDFPAIDDNALSQMFKAKILSLYFPETYLNVCSGEDLRKLAECLGLDRSHLSEYQYALCVLKAGNAVTRHWSNPKFMGFLYERFIIEGGKSLPRFQIVAPGKPKRKPVDFEEIVDDRARIGKLSEEFALQWEQARLRGAGHSDLVEKIKDHRDIPAYGYDFLSYSEPGRKRYIEVKSAGKDRKNGGYRFFLSENEREVSISVAHKDHYYFYIVFYDASGSPSHLVSKLASEVYKAADLLPCAFQVRFDVD